ncbi:MAG TPA: host attachment protein [Rhizomicrobium sp.]|nr:host attachment protein [Rhizomicrobium sp.]
MAKIGLINNLWILVCDGKKALLFQNVGDRVYPKLETREAFAHEVPPTRDLGTGQPGRIFNSAADGRRGAVEPTDFHTQEEERFLAQIAQRMERFATDHHIKALVVAAPPRALGFLRETLSQNVRALIRAEIDRDYVAQPVYEIEKHLAKALAE